MGKLSDILFSAGNFVANKIQQPAVILLYHRVTNLAADPQELAVSPANFDAQLQYLQANYNVLDAAQFLAYAQSGKPFPKRSVLITFDDGYADNYLEALPIMTKQATPALFYITTSKLNTTKEQWWDDLERVLLTGNTLPDTLHININGAAHTFNTVDTAAITGTYYALQAILRFCAPDVIDRAMQYLYSWAGCGSEGRPSHRMMTFDELKAMAASPYVQIGCHTHRHPAVGMLPYAQQLQEIGQSKEILESLLQQPIQHFSYPFGGRKFLGSKRYYNADSIKACKELGLQMVCANYYGQVHSWSNRFALPRILVRDWKEEEFASRMERFFKL
ncbi:polysaccharide deacetylase family protein [Chitinophaga sp. sic0106]|uniref:polysaccharide deacetylase family protein n=1 Tax=Chitinophaga sp. sic0106 TaxID=2854785 RepID=UPI001C463B59|nr:polysaccharide deacetylase family protein [Chitinophaga sp. sic0106]MBV7529480.1 polysaccharide deacetylase family protein [Chitinophaga sp. sic0106]